MIPSPFRKTLIVAGVATALGLGAVGCSSSEDSSFMPMSDTSQDVSDSAITTGVENQLARESDLDSSDISVATNDGTVTLTGSVRDAAARATAETVARSYDGVSSVANRIDVQSSSMGAAVERTGNALEATGDAAAQATSDTWITTKVKSVLLADSDAQGLDVQVDTKDGVVTLAGKLTTQAAIDHVKALTMDVEGVTRVNTTGLTIARL